MENGKTRLQKVQENVEEIQVMMMENLNKAREREGKLGDLENRAEHLLEQSKMFSKTATKVKHKKRWENMKWKLIIGMIIAFIIAAIIIGITLHFTLKTTSTQSSDPKETKV